MDNSTHLKRETKSSHGKFLIIFLFIVLMIGLGFGTWSFFNSKDVSVITQTGLVQTLGDDQLYVDAIGVESQYGYLAAQSSLDNLLIEGTEESATLEGPSAIKALVFVWLAKSRLALNEKSYSDAYSFAHIADGLKATVSSNKLMAKAKIGLGEDEAAIKYLEKALTMINGKTDNDISNKSEIQALIDNVKGKNE